MKRRMMRRSLSRAAAAALVWLPMVLAPSAWAQVVGDVCGCAGSPESLGSFVSSDQATWPPGSTLSGSTIVVPLSDDGVMIFDSFELRDLPAGGNAGLVFTRNDANSPVQLLVAGDVLIGTGDQLSLNGGRGQDGNAGGAAGRGAGGGPGGWRGGDGGYRFGSDSGYGGAGLGPGGGAPGGGTDLGGGSGGSLVVAADLLPLTGGSGGGGGSSQRLATDAACGGGGGGGGALLIAADGTVTVNGVISADGGDGGNRGSGNAVGGGGGSGGTVRIVANAITGSGQILARAGGGGFTSGQNGSPGAIRLEAFSITIPATSNVNPIAVRSSVLGPIALPLVPGIAITAIDGAAIPQPPLGWTGTQGVVDVVVPVAGTTTVEFETSGVPAGTLVDVSLVPRIGGGKSTQSVLIDALDCDAGGDCIGVASVDLASGSYVVEARPTFQTP